jgi:hypothetical protein
MQDGRTDHTNSETTQIPETLTKDEHQQQQQQQQVIVKEQPTIGTHILLYCSSKLKRVDSFVKSY